MIVGLTQRVLILAVLCAVSVVSATACAAGGRTPDAAADTIPPTTIPPTTVPPTTAATTTSTTTTTTTTTVPMFPGPGVVAESLSGDPSLTGRKAIALTFDDGPGPRTAEVLDLLRTHLVPATFFIVGSQVDRREDLLTRMVAEGHRVAGHTAHHTSLAGLPADAQFAEIRTGVERIEAVTGPGSVRCLRPPKGHFDEVTISAAAELGLGVLMWSVDPRDWVRPGAMEIVGRVVADLSPGAVVLLHDAGGDRSQTVEALPWIIAVARAEGYEFVPVC